MVRHTPAERQYCRFLHRRLCAELGIPPARLEFASTPCATRPGSSGSYDPGTGTIRLYQCPGKFLGVVVVAHETYHHYQRERGWLTRSHYRGRPKREWRERLPYRQWPWERAAYRYHEHWRQRHG